VAYRQRIRCRAHSRRNHGGQCRAFAMHGSLVCKVHGGAIGHVRAAAARREAARRALALLPRVNARAGTDQSPAEHLLDELYRSAAICEVYAELVVRLDQREQAIDRAEMPVVADGLLAPKPGWRGRPEVVVHPFVTLYAAERERRARIAKLAIDAGVAEATVRLAERTSGVIVAAFTAALADPELGLDEARQLVGRSVLARHLRAVEDTD
jgi:hypothetical protein